MTSYQSISKIEMERNMQFQKYIDGYMVNMEDLQTQVLQKELDDHRLNPISEIFQEDEVKYLSEYENNVDVLYEQLKSSNTKILQLQNDIVSYQAIAEIEMGKGMQFQKDIDDYK